MKYKCIIFDCDGVLVDSEEISISVLVEMASELGAKFEKEHALETFAGASLDSCFEEIKRRTQKELPHFFEKEFRKRTFQAFKEELKPIPGIHQLLKSVQVPYCVASNGPLEKTTLNLTTTGLIEQFENRIFSAYELKKWKPDPALFLYAAKSMGFSPSECVVIEDSKAGFQAAKSGGFDSYILTKSKNKMAFEEFGANTFSHMNQLLELLS